jgi:hypothetical protein
MADVDVNLDSSDLLVIVEALECLKDVLEHDERAGADDRHPRIVQLDLLINTFKSAQR